MILTTKLDVNVCMYFSAIVLLMIILELGNYLY